MSRGRSVKYVGCKVAECEESHYAKEMCRRHYVESRELKPGTSSLPDDKIAKQLGITIQTLHGMTYGEVTRYLAMAEQLERLRAGAV